MKSFSTKYFRDLPNGQTVEVKMLGYYDKAKAPISESEKAIAMELKGHGIMIGKCLVTGGFHPITREIKYKRNVMNRHECDARCMNGSCNGVCECRCGGKNHGKGMVADA
jgi:hypothetical protein